MKKFKAFYFEDFSFDKETLKAVFLYSFDKSEYFEEEIDFSCQGFEIRSDLDLECMDVLLFQTHLALGISYYKLFPTKILFVESGFLDVNQLLFWKKFYKNGLGEFLYTNKISPHDLLDFHVNSDHKYQKKDFNTSENSLVPLGGGKDSLVTIELLHEGEYHFDTVVFGKMDSVKTSVSEQLLENNLLICRMMSQNLFRLNDMQYYNGHVPITGIIAFILYVAAYLYDYRNIIMSNELSANEGSFDREGFHINHQYSKSLEFEQDLQEYMYKNVTQNIRYFSLLRGMHEYKIAEIFSKKCKKYFSTFASCNKNFFIHSQKIHEGNWCLSCDKCIFVYIILSAHLERESMEEIFTQNLFERPDLISTFRDVLGIGKHKPFECVGTNEESVFSLLKFFDSNKKEGWLYEMMVQEILPKMTQSHQIILQEKLENIYDDDIIPVGIKQKILGQYRR